MKTKTLILSIILLHSIFFTNCKKDGGLESANSDETQNPIGTGKFSIGGKTYTGDCVATTSSTIGNNGLDVGIVTSNGDAFAIGNLSTASNGSVPFSDGWSQPAGTTFGVISVPSVFMGTRSGGKITKTGPKTFTFSCTVYEILSSSQYTVTGSGNYR